MKPLLVRLAVTAVLLAGCSDGRQGSSRAPDAGADAGRAPAHPVHPEAAARGFKLYYKERLHRVMRAYHLFGMFGDSVFGATNGRVAVAKDGNEYEVVAGFHPNSLIGTPVFSAYYAYKIFQTRELELTFLRMLEGLVFYEEVSGHPGMTAREVLPGWTRMMDGVAGKVTRDRLGKPFTPPALAARDTLEAEYLSTFYAGLRVRYRENPEDYFFTYFPAVDTADYALTYSFPELPKFLRMFECCETFMRTPDDYKWGGAYWGNHNSRDNLPDFSLGFVAAQLAAHDDQMSPAVREVARRAVDAGRRIGDSVFEHDGVMVTVGETTPYDELVVSGAIRPHGTPENEDLGSLANCPDAYLVRALSSDGLTLPVPELPMPGATDVEGMLREGAIDCPAEPMPTCRALDQGFCGKRWSETSDLTVGGLPAFDLVRKAEAAVPGTAERLLGKFQNDFDDIVEAMMTLVHHAIATGDEELLAATRATEKDMSDVMRFFADLIWATSKPELAAEQRYAAAVLDALAGTGAPEDDLGDFAPEESRIATMEALLDMDDTTPAPLKTDAEIKEAVEARVTAYETEMHPSGRGERIVERYRKTWSTEPPVRRKGDAYEGRRKGGDWMPAERPHHVQLPYLELVQALPICAISPEVLDCTWAVLGCQRPDLDHDGDVDPDDVTRFEKDYEAGRACDKANHWCNARDLDRSGTLDGLDEAFLTAAHGCHYER